MAVTPTVLGKPKCDAKGANTRKNTFAERVVLGCSRLLRLWITLCIGLKMDHSLSVSPVVSKNDFKKTTESRTTCSKGVYRAPQPEDVPDVLRGVTRAIVLALRTVKLHCGREHRYGYRHSRKTVPLSWSLASMETRIDALVVH